MHERVRGKKLKYSLEFSFLDLVVSTLTLTEYAGSSTATPQEVPQEFRHSLYGDLHGSQKEKEFFIPKEGW